MWASRYINSVIALVEARTPRDRPSLFLAATPLICACIIMCKTQWNHVHQDKGTESSVPITEVVIRLSLCLRQKKPSVKII